MTSPRITILTAMRNEGPFVIEWLAHHRAIGVTDTIVVTNDCDDGTDLLLEALAAGGAVRHLRQPGEGGRIQWRALKLAAAEAAYRSTDWAMAIDCDEFVVPKVHDGLGAMLAATDVADAVVLPWRLFGSSGHLRFEDRPVTERFLRAAPAEIAFPVAARFFKTLFRVAAFERPGVHRPKGGTGAWVDGSGRPLPEAFGAAAAQIVLPDPRVACELVQLNHYSLRSAEDFLVKRRRGLPNRASKPLDATYWAERNFNTDEVRAAERFSGVREAEAARLMALPGVAAAREACVAAHRAQIADLLNDPEEARLYTRLALLPGSVVPDASTTDRLLRIVSAAGKT